jgi:dipeptidyl-peptidase 4
LIRYLFSLSLFLVSVVTTASAYTSSPKPLTVAEIFRGDQLTGVPPTGLTWSPDSKHLTYLRDGELMEVDLATAKLHPLINRERLAALVNNTNDEKDKDHRERYKMANYLWAPDSAHLLFDTNGRLWLYDLHTNAGFEIGFTGAGSGDDPKFSPNGEFISYLRDHDLFLKRVKDPESPVTQLTNGREKTIQNGEVDWVYEEELAVRSNYFWAPDSKHIAYLQMNETQVPEYPLVDWILSHAPEDRQRYPLPGDPNPDVRLGVIGLNGGKTTWIKLPVVPGQDYIPRFGWLNSHTIWAEVLTRNHKSKSIYFADSATGATKLALAEIAEKFFDEDYDLTVLDDQILLTSWRDGHSHIYVYSFDAQNPLTSEMHLERQLTKGDFEVSSIESVDAAKQMVYYLSNEGDPLQHQIWQIRLDGSLKRRLSEEEGVHEPKFASSDGFYVDTWSAKMTPPKVSVCHAGHGCNNFWESHSVAEYGLKAPERLDLKFSDGTLLYGYILLPSSTETASVPLIVNPYGGPHAQAVRDNWGQANFLFDELLTEHGFAVLHVDNRGMGGRGRDFAYAAYHDFGPVQLQDQLRAIDAVLAKYPQLDGKRLGWWGWSWGGSFTLYALSHSNRFAAGVAVAPVTDWHNYDSIYTERYLGQPAEFPSGYKDFSVINQAQNLKGRLLLVHGTGDDNVHMGNSIQYIQQLISADIPFDLQLYPRKTHSIAGNEARTHLFERILAHFEENLMHSSSPVSASPSAAMDSTKNSSSGNSQ